MRVGIFFISLAIMVGLGLFLNWIFNVFVPIEESAPINWFAGIIGLGVIAGLILAGVYFIIKFKKTL